MARQPVSNIEDLAQRLDRMEMDTDAMDEQQQRQQNNNEYRRHDQEQRVATNNNYNQDDEDEDDYDGIYDNNERRMSIDGENIQPTGRVINNNSNNSNNNNRAGLQQTDRTARDETNKDRTRDNSNSSILIVTNVDPIVFSDALVKAKFESLFKAYDEQVQIRYLKSFRRIRLDYSGFQQAEMARVSMNNYRLGDRGIKCYLAQMIRPNNRTSSLDTNEDDNNDENDQVNPYGQDSNYLSIPKRSKQFLLSPPISPPEGWAPQEEATPCIDIQLVSALANLVPGEMHALHEGNESQPHIFVEVCEEVEQDPHLKSINSGRGRIPKTPSPFSMNTGSESPMES